MKRKEGRGRPMNSNKIKVVPVNLDKVDIEKLSQALICIAKTTAKKDAALSRPEINERP